MRLILPPSKKQSRFGEQSNKLNVEGKTIENYFDIAETFNNYLVKVDETLADKMFPTSQLTCKKYLRNRIQNSIFLDALRPNKVYNTIKFLKCKKLSKKKKCNTLFFQKSSRSLAGILFNLEYFFTLSFDFGIFPDMLKIAAVTPIHKTDSTTIISNYRLFSVLPCLSKILEKLIKT